MFLKSSIGGVWNSIWVAHYLLFLKIWNGSLFLQVVIESLYLKNGLFLWWDYRNKMSYVHMNFPGSPREFYVPHKTFCEFCLSLYMYAPFLVRLNYKQTLKRQAFLHVFIKKKSTKTMNTFHKSEETICRMCTWICPVCSESRYVSHTTFLEFQLSCKMWP